MLSCFHVLRVVCVFVCTQSLMKVTVESPKRLNNYELGLVCNKRYDECTKVCYVFFVLCVLCASHE